ncbi:hypothetical protein FPQ18DRAFT_327970 [Pyronema domesticum]|nr:hypothetical protein FPQ18DRAFT_327970 [Pyronema domesticum]
MQTFLTRSSRTVGPTCSLTNALLCKSTPPPTTSTAVICTATVEHGYTAGSQHPQHPQHPQGSQGSQVLFRRFGDFYKRFYSTMTKAVGRDHRHLNRVRNDGTTSRAIPRTAGCAMMYHNGPPDGYIEGVNPEKGETWDMEQVEGWDMESGEAEAGFMEGEIQEAPEELLEGEAEAMEALDKEAAGGKPPRETPVPYFRYQPGRRDAESMGTREARQNTTHPNTIEQSVQRLATYIHNHDELMKALEREIARRKRLRGISETEEDKDMHAQEISALERVYIRITQRLYDPALTSLVFAQIEASQARAPPTEPQMRPRPYLPPYPHYINFDAPTDLNKALLDVFQPREPEPTVYKKLLYNLLTTQTSPDITSFNIMLHGFTIYRQNSLAHMVLQCMVEADLILDDYSAAILINLTTKSNDHVSYHRVVNILQHQVKTANGRRKIIFPKKGHPEIPPGPMVISKFVWESIINGSARYGHIKAANMYLKRMTKAHPTQPMSMVLTTSLVKLCTEKRNWNEGKKLWRRVWVADKIAVKEGKPSDLDIRFYRAIYFLCKACNKYNYIKLILKQAETMGWDEKKIEGPPEKTKGMLATSEVKVPRLAVMTKIWSRYTRALIRRTNSYNSQGQQGMRPDKLLKAMEKVFEDTRLWRKETSRLLEIQNERWEKWNEEYMKDQLLPELVRRVVKDQRREKEEQRGKNADVEVGGAKMEVELAKPAQETKETKESRELQRSLIWQTIISQRLPIARDGALIAQHDIDATSPTNPEDTVPTSTTGIPSWKPDLAAFTRGVETQNFRFKENGNRSGNGNGKWSQRRNDIIYPTSHKEF